MKAIVRDRYGSADVLRHADIERPEPGPGEVLVRVRAAALNHGDRVDLHGTPLIVRPFFGLRRPRRPVLGRAVAGTVAAVGAGVSAWRPGDEVLAETVTGGFAEHVAVPAGDLAAKPAAVTFEQAATLPVAGTTALQALRRAGVEAGRAVLVNGASGGVGSFAVQLCKVYGAEVTAVCSTRNAAQARALGADRVIDYTRTDFTRDAQRFDAVIDLAGGHSIAAMRRLLALGGVYVASSGTGGRWLGPIPRLLVVALTGPLRGGRLRVLAAHGSAADLGTLTGLVADGRVTPVIERTVPLEGTAGAIRAWESEHARGKIVLTLA
jgi:NADPH:quinone reductase-like Zn-dependent oxidoreductase